MRPLEICAMSGLLAAGSRRADQIGRRFDDVNSSFGIRGTLLCLAVLAVIGVVVWLAFRIREKRETGGYNSPRRLFQELCLAHRLSPADRQLLANIAAWHGLTNPSLLFLQPERLLTAEMLAELNCQADAARLQAKLFGDG